MKHFLASLIRLGDDYIISSNIKLNLKEKCDYCSISFKCGTSLIKILSTTYGEIADGVNLIISDFSGGSPNINVSLEYCTSSNKLECLAGYYNNKSLVNYESFFTDFDNTKEIKSSNTIIPIISTRFKPFNERWDDFNKLCKSRTSPWEIKMSCRDDILINVVSKGGKPIVVSFGEMSDEVLSSDYLFELDENMDILYIPRLILEKKYKLYGLQCDLGIFELVQPDFINSEYVYKKVLVSNIMNISEFAK